MEKDQPTEKFKPPIQALDEIDFAGKRNDGGVDLIIMASAAIDDGIETLNALRQKVSFYLQTIDSAAFQQQLEHPLRDKTTIVLVCEYPISARAINVLEECQALAATRGIRLELRESMENAPEHAPNIEETVRAASDEDMKRIAALESRFVDLVYPHEAKLPPKVRSDIGILQWMENSGLLKGLSAEDMESVGIVFGQALVDAIDLRWITVDWSGVRVLALQCPITSVMVFPGSMVAKRFEEGSPVNFMDLFAVVSAQVKNIKNNPEYCR